MFDWIEATEASTCYLFYFMSKRQAQLAIHFSLLTPQFSLCCRVHAKIGLIACDQRYYSSILDVRFLNHPNS
jgi:hypothetical protein